MTPIGILSVGTALPAHRLTQDAARDWARTHFSGRFSAFERMEPVFTNSGIDTRHTAMPIEWYGQDQDWASRTAAYRTAGSALFLAAARQALDKASLLASQIDIVVTISSTGIATPSLEALVHDELGLRADVVRVPVFGLGCAGGVSGLALAARLAASQPGAKVLMVAVELCTLAFRNDVLSKANIVATALFGDGAAAVVLSSEHEGAPTITAAGEHLWPASLDVMGWDVAPQGLGVVFARSIPDLITAQLREALTAMLGRLGTRPEDMARFICHPGGAKVIDALEGSLGMAAGRLDVERAVLRACGNMSAPTVLFVLETLLSSGRLARGGAKALIALGPGFTASCAVLAGEDA
jgi:alkylresorcinol/alkylpyrone synthase